MEREGCLWAELSWRGRWWLLDVETSGLDCQENDIIALRLACMEDRRITQEWELLVRPRQALTSWAERITGISNRELEQAVPLEEALEQLEVVNASGRLLLFYRDFTIPFLENAYRRCGKAFRLDYFPLECLAERLGFPGRKRAGKLLEQIPPPPPSWPYVPPKNGSLEQLYRLALALFHQWEGIIRATPDSHGCLDKCQRMLEMEEFYV